MSYLEDKEKRLLFSALSREKKVCKQVDEESCREPYETSLESIVCGLQKKFYYDRFEKEIQNMTIEDFIEQIEKRFLGVHPDELHFVYTPKDIVNTCRKIAEQMKSSR